jgi:hypothetical protein
LSNVTIQGGKVWAKAIEGLITAGQGLSLQVGILEGATRSGAAENSYMTPASLMDIHEFGRGNNPERSVLRRGLEEHGGEWGQNVSNYVKANAEGAINNPQGTLENALNVAGEIAKSDLQTYINKSLLAPLSPKRIKRKQEAGWESNAAVPLAASGGLLQSFGYKVTKGG